jgi:hypothetical protein
MCIGPNNGSYGGMFYFYVYYTPTTINVFNCTFLNLSLNSTGGCLRYYSYSGGTNITIDDCIFSSITVLLIYL